MLVWNGAVEWLACALAGVAVAAAAAYATWRRLARQRAAYAAI